MKKVCPLLAGSFAVIAVLTLCSCSKPVYIDGSYTGLSSKDEDGAWAKVTITLKANEIVDAQYITYQADGSIKDESYGAGAGELGNSGFYKKAQHAVEAMKIYREELVAKKSLAGVDRISGATIAYDQFTEAVTNALNQAESE